MSGELEPRRSSATSLPHGARLHTTGVELPDKLSFEEWRDVLRAVCIFDRTFRFAVADVVFYGDGEYGSRYDDAIALTGLSPSRLYAIAWVAGQFSPDRRRPQSRLTFGHFEEVAKFDLPEQEYWLNLAEESEWTRDQLREAAHNTLSTRPADRGQVSASSAAGGKTYTPPERPAPLLQVAVGVTKAERDRWRIAGQFRGHGQVSDWLRTIANTGVATVISDPRFRKWLEKNKLDDKWDKAGAE